MPDGRRYLPDFRVENIDGDIGFYEIKPTHEADNGKLTILLEHLENIPVDWDNEGSGKTYLNYFGRVLTGDPYRFIVEGNNYPCPRCMQFTVHFKYCFNNENIDVLCQPCDVNTPSEGDVQTDFGYRVQEWKGAVCVGDEGCGDYTDVKKYFELVWKACTAARQARFEFGQTPACRNAVRITKEDGGE